MLRKMENRRFCFVGIFEATSGFEVFEDHKK
jgi:hypothetical protein